MEINFYATFREIAGRKTVEFPLSEGATVRELVALVVERFPAMQSQLLREDGELHGHVHVFVNGRDSSFIDNALDAVISAEDKIDIFPAVGGGCLP